MAEVVTFVRAEQQETEEQVVAEFANGKYYQILLTPEEQHRCTVDQEFLNEILARASTEHGPEISIDHCYEAVEIKKAEHCYEAAEEKKDDYCYEAVEVKKSDSLSGNAMNTAKWSDEKTLLLLTLVKQLSPHTKSKMQRRPAWESIANIFYQNGYTDSAIAISKKWFNLKDRYKIIMKKKNSSAEHATWPYFDTIHEILGHQGVISTPLDNLLSSMALIHQNVSRVSGPSAEDSASSSTYESYKERKHIKRRKKQMTGRSKKRRLRGKANDQTLPQAPAWFATYLKGIEDERKWREEISDIMKDGTVAVKSLAASIAEFARK